MFRTTMTTMRVRRSGELSDFVAASVSEHDDEDNVSAYMQDLIRRGKERKEQEALNRLEAELTHVFAAPENSYCPLSAADVIARNRG